jgi:choline dehydrogenase-like flavoprotein
MQPNRSQQGVDLRRSRDESPTFDVVVIGTGMGGATIGYELARLGRSVLFLEKGRDNHREVQPNALAPTPRLQEDPVDRLRSGRWPYRIEGESESGTITFFAPLGCGTGGSSALYAGQLERMRPCDFEPGRYHSRADGAEFPDVWPVSYSEMTPHYERAERLYGVCGTEDPLFPVGASMLEPPALSDRDQDLVESFEELGLHPYRAHVACRYLPGCLDCAGRLCPRACKLDSGWACLVPALRLGAQIESECEVVRLETQGRAVTKVLCRGPKGEFAVQGRTVILSAGAFGSPTLLLRSRDARWPNGLANSSGLVGRYLMFHACDFFAVRPRRSFGLTGPNKSITLNDFYVNSGRKMGSFHNMGIPVSYGFVLMYLQGVLDRWPMVWNRLLRPFLRAPALLGAQYFRHAGIFASVVEDLPYRENRVELADNPSGFRFHYRYPPELRERVILSRQLLRAAIGRRRMVRLSPDLNLNYGHVCGTCRAGEDPATSVLDINSKAHDLDNLFVVDSSFFPTSGGINPSLTIAANALRVGSIIHAQLP